ncbi:hypothetical protein ACVMGC_009173 [Bradyrhizobium barranii subsp. barranii]
MARGDFPFFGAGPNLRAIVARPRVRAELGVLLDDRRPGVPQMLIKYSSDISFPGEVESPLPEDVVVLADRAGVALGVQRLLGVRVRSVSDHGSGVSASRRVEIPLVGGDGEISGVLFRTAPRSSTRGVAFARGSEGERSVRRPRHQQPSRCDRRWTAAARVPERRRVSRGDRWQNAGSDYARRVAQPSVPRYCATMPQVDRRLYRRQSSRSDRGYA